MNRPSDEIEMIDLPDMAGDEFASPAVHSASIPLSPASLIAINFCPLLRYIG